MGLDITAFEKVTLVRAMTVKQANEHGYDEDAGTLFYKDHPTRTQGDDMAEGLYSTDGERHAFRAGSYGGYNMWRRMLAKMTGTTDEEVWKRDDLSGPFMMLIHFSDCEGYIGPKTSAKLAADFDEWRERAAMFAAGAEDKDDGEWFLKRYEDWSKAFHIAARGGAVHFH